MKTHGENRNSPEMVALHWRIERSQIAHEMPMVRGAMEGRIERAECLQLLDDVIEHAKNGKWNRAIICAYVAGQKYAEAKLARMAEAEQAAERNRDAGGEANKTPKAEMRRQLAEWNKLLAPYRSKSRGMVREGIPRSTYFKYQKEFRTK